MITEIKDNEMSKQEKIEPCQYCGCECDVEDGLFSTTDFQVVCDREDTCGYQGMLAPTEARAIAVHNMFMRHYAAACKLPEREDVINALTWYGCFEDGKVVFNEDECWCDTIAEGPVPCAYCVLYRVLSQTLSAIDSRYKGEVR